MCIKAGDEVAILHDENARPSQTLEIAKVLRAGEVYIELTDGRMFATLGGKGLNTKGYLEPARDENRAAIAKRLHPQAAAVA